MVFRVSAAEMLHFTLAPRRNGSCDSFNLHNSKLRTAQASYQLESETSLSWRRLGRRTNLWHGFGSGVVELLLSVAKHLDPRDRRCLEWSTLVEGVEKGC